ncbi:MAG TPA: hypothetical protein VIV34_05190 [Pseudolabrys sp.]
MSPPTVVASVLVTLADHDVVTISVTDNNLRRHRNSTHYNCTNGRA